MSDDYHQCTNCNSGFRGDSDYCVWCECENCFCSKRCGKLDNYGEYDEKRNSFRIDPAKPVTCVICRDEVYTDYILLESVMKHFNITKEQAINIWRMEKHGK